MRKIDKKTDSEVIRASGIPVHCAHSELVQLSDLKPNPRNSYTHPKRQIELLAKIIRHHGWRVAITVSNRSGLVVRGHCRIEAAKVLGVSEVPIDRQDYASDEEELADLLADNRIAELAERDFGVLSNVLEELDTGAFDMELTGFSQEELEDIFTWHSENAALKPIATEPPPPAMAWVLVGIPTVRYGEIAADVERLAEIPGAVVETTVSSE